MTVASGGYQTGRSYSWYRSYGHNPLSAWFMVHQDTILFFDGIVLGAIVGWLLGGML